MFFDTVSDATSIWIKGREFTVAKMLGESYGKKAAEYEGGSLAIFRLAPQGALSLSFFSARSC